MEQLMWMFSFLPAWVYHLLLICAILGLAGASFLGKLPFFNQYKLPFQVLMAIILVFAIWMQGVMANEEKWQSKIKEMEDKVAAAEAKGQEKTVEIQEKVVEKTRVIKEKGQDVIKFVDRVITKKEEVVKFVEHCSIPKDIIELHNQAVTMNLKEGDKK